MNKKNTEYLLKKYPKIFQQYKSPPTETAMCWGFECGDGWRWLIDNLCKAIQSHCKTSKQDIQVLQVKEKFGGLRFYIDSADEETYGMISLAEEMSYSICESCGSAGEDVSQTTGYIMTLCKKCKDKNRTIR